ncbi:MAG: LytTR family transcriptional regulator [Cyclobacteriaceae bacterium]
MKIKSQVVFWILSLTGLIIFFGQKWTSSTHAFYYSSMLLPVAIATSWVFNSFLVPRYLFTKRYLRFVIYSIYLTIISIWASSLIGLLSFIYLANYNYDNLNPVVFDILAMGLVLYFLVFANSFIILVKMQMSGEIKLAQLEADVSRNAISHIDIRANRENHPVRLDELMFIESMGDYVKVHTLNDSLITKEKISSLEDRLPDQFIRVHRSFIVNASMIQSYTRESITLTDHEIPVSRKYKTKTLDYLSKLAAETPR